MIQASDPSAVSIVGPLTFVLLVALALVLPISFVLIKRYRRAVSKSMGRSAGSPANRPAPLVSSQSPQQAAQPEQSSVAHYGAGVAELYSEVLHAPRRTAAVYFVAGACYAFIMTIAAFVSDDTFEIAPIRFISLFWIYLWPVVLTVNLVAAATRRAKFASVAVYFLILAIIIAISIPISSGASWGLLLAWTIYNLPATVLLLTFLNRRVRAVGPLVLIFLLLAVLGSQLALSILLISDVIIYALLDAVGILGLGHITVFYGLALLGFVIVWPLGWLLLRIVRSLYEQKKISDQSISIDAIWLLFGIAYSLMLASGEKISDWWIFSGLLAFIGFKIVAWAGLRLLNSRTSETKNLSRLLLLRVFSLGKQSERMFSALATHWRHVGNIELIAGPDLATSTLEPHEFLDFVSGKLGRRFIDGPQALEQRISEMDIKPDQDGRFRVNDFFCHLDTWKMVLSSLVKETDAVMMDLRGFTSENRGCLHEIDELVNIVPLGRVVFIIQSPADEELLRNTVKESWKLMRPTSPNCLSTPDELRLFPFTDSRGGELPQLLRALCTAANPQAVSSKQWAVSSKQ